MPSQVKAASGVTHVEEVEEELVTYPPGDSLQLHAHIPDFNIYQALYDKSIHHPQEFWTEVASDFYWKSPPSGKVLDYNFDLTKGNIFVEFMKGAKTNVCYNVLDRNVLEKNLGAKTAYFW
ncbi:hypothetical protein AB205_0002800 [Aquarana catesbeiana]|uniref:Acetyl-coenzyme A synthetase N-terminal domain-containing protein n=2 Tax=Aquarana catesbeiana TaxID=8400 RepID=A0A2G9P7Z4_AQUCT|nr:hypothetical protein AB205_0002800 [Aquarana catesbeiana]